MKSTGRRALFVRLTSTSANIYADRYRYMLEAFVNQIKDRIPHVTVDAQESIDNMTWLDKIYEEVCKGCLHTHLTRIRVTVVLIGRLS